MRENYQAFLLRFQRSDDALYWRVRLVNAQNGEVKRFATEKEAIRYLLKILYDGSGQKPSHI